MANLGSLSQFYRQLTEFDAALIANTLGYIDPTPPEQIYLGGSIQCQTPGFGPMVGTAVTCEIDSSSPGGTPDVELFYEQLEQIRGMAEPAVWVVKAVGSRPDHECILGDGMAKNLFSVGCIGVVTDGGLRDLPGFATVPFQAFARGTVIHHTALRVRSINQPVEVAGVTLRTGDVIHGSSEGVIRIPRGSLELLPERAAKMRAFEHEAHFYMRDPDMPAKEKGARVRALLVDYGFIK